jgi:hypothetical protein
MDSNEFHTRRARQHLDLMIPVLRRLSRRSYDDERQEITDWARLASFLSDGPFWSVVTEPRDTTDDQAGNKRCL